MMADETAVAVAEAGAVAAGTAASRAALALTVAYKDFSFSLTVDNVWLAGGVALGTFALGAYYLKNRQPAEQAIRNALERNEDGVVDPEVRNIADGSILVELCCHTERSFLSFVEDFETNRIKFKLEEEFRKIGYTEELKVTINNLEEVYKYVHAIRHKRDYRFRTTYKVIEAISIGLIVANFLLNTWRVLKAMELCKECLIILSTKVVTKEEEVVKRFHKTLYWTMFKAYCLVSDYTSAIQYGRKLLDIYRRCGESTGESNLSMRLAMIYQHQGKYAEAKQLYEDALIIMIETGNRNGEAYAYGNLGIISQSLGEYSKAREYFEKALAIMIEIGDRKGEASSFENLGIVFQSLGTKVKAKECLEKALVVMVEIGDRKGEASAYGNLGTVFQSLGEYSKAREYFEKALAIMIEIGDRKGEASAYGNLGNVFLSLGEYFKAREYLEKALAIMMEIGEKKGEAAAYVDLGTVFQSLGEYFKAKEHLEKALAVSKEIGDRNEEASAYGNLGILFHSLGEYSKAREYFEKALAIMIEFGNRKGEASAYGNLGNVFLSLGESFKAREYLEKALAIMIEIGEKKGEAAAYVDLGTVFQSLGGYLKAKQYLKKALAVSKEIGDRNGEASAYGNLAIIFQSLGEYVKANDYIQKAFEVSKDIRDVPKQFICLCALAWLRFLERKFQQAFDNFVSGTQKLEEMRASLGDNDRLKASFSEMHVSFYSVFSALLCAAGNHLTGLYVLELGRSRALTDLMSDLYSVENQLSSDPQSWVGIENVMKRESNCACLYVSCHSRFISCWVLKTTGITHYREMEADENFEILVKKQRPFQAVEGNSAGFRLAESDEEENEKEEQRMQTTFFHDMIIAPVADFLQEPEIIIVPGRSLYNIPFAALPDKRGKYLSDVFRIRFVPSLTTLKIIQDIPADYHSQTGALIVGDPSVGRVLYKGMLKKFSSLPVARKEAEMIGTLLGVQPLLADHATKQAVLQRIHSASLIHFATHGGHEGGAIVLAPLDTGTSIPVDHDYLLTIADISGVQLRNKLVVLSICGAREDDTVEGIPRLARAFLGSGVRSVLLIQWPVGGTVIEQFMSRFYEHLVRGESASESLHEAVKWMRDNGFSDLRQWAAFRLIGDNVSFDFGQ